MKRDYGDYIEDIVRSVNDVEEFTREVSFDEFIQDKKTVYAVVRALEIWGKLLRRYLSPLGTLILISPGRRWLECETS